MVVVKCWSLKRNTQQINKFLGNTKPTRNFIRKSKLFVRCEVQEIISQAIKGTILEDYITDETDQYNKLLTTKIHRSESVAEISDVVEKEEGKLNPTNVTTAFFTVARLIGSGRYVRSGHPQKQEFMTIFYELLQLSQKQINQMSPRQIANTLWSMSRGVIAFNVNLEYPQFNPLFRKLLKQAVKLKDMLNTEDVATILLATAQAHQKDEQNFQILLEQGMKLNSIDYVYNEIASIIWAMAISNQFNTNAIRFYLYLAKQRFKQLSPTHLGNILWSMRVFRYADFEFIEMTSDAIQTGKYKFGIEQLRKVLQAFMDFGIDDEFTIRNLGKQLLKKKNIHPQGLVNSIYSLSILKARIEVVQELVDNLQDLNFQKDLRFDGYNQLGRVIIQYASMGYVVNMRQDLRLMCFEYMKNNVTRISEIPNSFIDEVYKSVQRKFSWAQKRVPILDGLLWTNIELICGNVKIAIQTCSYTCYTTNEPQILMGNARAYQELIERCGWRVVVVSSLDWFSQPGYEEFVLNEIENCVFEYKTLAERGY